MTKKCLIGINFFLLKSILLCQEIPNEFYDFARYKVLSENGYNWNEETTFGPIRYRHNFRPNDSLTIDGNFGSIISNKSKVVFGYAHFSYKQHFYGYLYPRIVSNSNTVDRFSGLPRDISRGGFNAGETDLSGISFEKNWLIFQFGRGRQSWGAGNNIQLALSENSPAYDYGLIDLNFTNLRVRYFHGFLESDSLQNNRYINGRGLEWRNNKNLLIGISETIIYSGPNRNIDFAYLNPISTHLEIELNNKQNLKGTDNANGVWQFSLDYLTQNKSRISFNYLFDEFTFDKSQMESGKEKFNAYSLKIIKSLIRNDEHLLNLYFSQIMIGKNTFRHESGLNNFVHRNKPLGHSFGSDFKLNSFGINSFYKSKILTQVEIGSKKQGLNSILIKPYKRYDFSNTNINDTDYFHFVNLNIDYWYEENISLFLRTEYNIQSSEKQNINFILGLNIYYKMLKVI